MSHVLLDSVFDAGDSGSFVHHHASSRDLPPTSIAGETGAAVCSVLTTDFCPWANRYVYWLKEPIGWFAMAWLVSILVGMHLNPMGWTLAAAITSIMAVGMAWPWVAVRASRTSLRPAVERIHEDDACDLILSVRNPLPLPMWGLSVEGYLDRKGDEIKPTVALACVPPLSEADYRLAVHPNLRGQYPQETPQVTCSFPFGIWTARRPLHTHCPLTVLPKVSTIQDEASLAGGRMADCGDGLRAGQVGEPLGVREFRSGDRLRNVHWAHTARTGRLVVCERGGPQQQAIEVSLDTRSLHSIAAASRPVRRSSSTSEQNRSALAWRVRVAASLVTHLHARHLPVALVIDGQRVPATTSAQGLQRMLTALAEVPADGNSMAIGHDSAPRGTNQGITLHVSGSADGYSVLVDFDERRQAHAFAPSTVRRIEVRLDQDIPSQLTRFWREVQHGRSAA